MGLFGLTTLFGVTSSKFGTEQRTGKTAGSIMPFEGARGFTHNVMKYPLDIGDYPRGHYMVIHINEQRKTQFSTSTRGGSTGGMSTIQQNKQKSAEIMGGHLTSVSAMATSGVSYAKAGVGVASELLDKTPLTKHLKENAGNILDAGVNLLGLNSQIPALKQKAEEYQSNLSTDSFLRTTVRTTESIVLYMPNTIAFDLSQKFAQPEIGGSTLGGLVGMLTAGGRGTKDEAGANMLPFAVKFGADKLGDVVGNSALTQSAFTGATGMVTNPQIEVLYQSPSLRSFDFTFELYPVSQKEAEEVQKIIAALLFHQAPEIVGAGAGGGIGGYFMTPPSEFDIQFYYNGKENPNIPQISTCVLQGLNVDYTPDGNWQAYEVGTDLTPKMGASGMPVGIRIRLSFLETEMMTKLNYGSAMYALNNKNQQEQHFDP